MWDSFLRLYALGTVVWTIVFCVHPLPILPDVDLENGLPNGNMTWHGSFAEVAGSGTNLPSAVAKQVFADCAPDYFHLAS